MPAVAVALGDLLGDRQTLADVRHAGVGLADAALELPVERDIVEIELHGWSLPVFIYVVDQVYTVE